MSDYASMADRELLEAWKAYDQRAGATLLRRHHTSVARFFAHRLGPDSEDLVQATFLGLLESLDRFRGESSFRTFLFAIARNQLLTAIHDRVRDRDRFDPGQTSIAALDPSASALMVAKTEHKLLLAALQRLPIDVQIMLELHYWEKMKVREIAEVLGMNLNTVKTQMKRGRQTLHEELEALAESRDQLETTVHGLSKWAARLREELGHEIEVRA